MVELVFGFGDIGMRSFNPGCYMGLSSLEFMRQTKPVVKMTFSSDRAIDDVIDALWALKRARQKHNDLSLPERARKEIENAEDKKFLDAVRPKKRRKK